MSIDRSESVTLFILDQSGSWFARIQELGLTGEGKTEKDALDDLKRTLAVFAPALAHLEDWTPVDGEEVDRCTKLVESGRARFEEATLDELLSDAE